MLPAVVTEDGEESMYAWCFEHTYAQGTCQSVHVAFRHFISLTLWCALLQGKSSSAPELYALQSAYYATDGNAKELRRWQRRLTEAPPSTLMASMQSQGARWGKQLPEEAEESDALPSQQTVLAGRQHMQQELTYAQQSAGL